MNENKKEVAHEVPVQEQQVIVTLEISNLDEFKALIAETIDRLNQLKNFKFEVKTSK